MSERFVKNKGRGVIPDPFVFPSHGFIGFMIEASPGQFHHIQCQS